MNGNHSQVGGLAECNGECSRLIPSLQLPPILNHTIRICQWATSLVFAHSGDRQGQMASRDSPKPPQQPAENQVTLPERKCCHLSQSSLPLMLYPNASMWTNTCLWIILPCTSTLCILCPWVNGNKMLFVCCFFMCCFGSFSEKNNTNHDEQTKSYISQY